MMTMDPTAFLDTPSSSIEDEVQARLKEILARTSLTKQQTQELLARTGLTEQQKILLGKQINQYSLYGGQSFEQNLNWQQFQFQKENAGIQNDLQRQSLDLQAQVRRGELTLQAASLKLDRAYKEASLRQNERIARANALTQAQQLELQAAPYRLPKGQQYFPGFEPSGLASQLAKQYGFNFTAPESVPIPFDPLAKVETVFPQGGDQNITLPDTTEGLSFNFTSGASGGGGGPAPFDQAAYLRKIASYQRAAIGNQGGQYGMLNEDVQQLGPSGGNVPLPPLPGYTGAVPGQGRMLLGESSDAEAQAAIAEQERLRQIAAGYGVELR